MGLRALTLTVTAAVLVALAGLTAAVTGGPGSAAAVEPNGPTVLWAVGDLCDDDNDVPGCETVADLIAADPEADVFAPLGDIQYENGSPDKYLAYYDPKVGSKLNPITMPVPGNHEYVTPGAAGYYGYFGAAAGDPTKGYYSRTIGNWTLAVVNSNCGKIVGGCGYRSVQGQWLDSVLQQPETCEVILGHHPPMSDGASYDPGVRSQRGFIRHGWENRAELSLTGHEHSYQRFGPVRTDNVPDPDGIVPVVIGNGGKSFGLWSDVYNRTVARNNTDFGALRLVLSDTGYTGQFIATDGTVLDTFTGTCRTL